MTPYRAFERMYRMDALAEEDWSSICSPVRAPGQGPPPKEPSMPGVSQGSESLRIDYLKGVLKPLSWYSVDLKKAAVDEAGCPTEMLDRQYFQIVQVVTSQTRPHLMPTVKSHDETMLRSRLALNIQSVTVKPDAEDPAGGVAFFEDSDSEWRSWAELGPWPDVQGSLRVFNRVEG